MMTRHVAVDDQSDAYTLWNEERGTGIIYPLRRIQVRDVGVDASSPRYVELMQGMSPPRVEDDDSMEGR